MTTDQLTQHNERMKQVEKLNEHLAVLVKRGEAIHVTDQATDLQAKQYEIECTSYEKAVDVYADPDIADARERLSGLQAAKKMLLAPVLTVMGVVRSQRRLWEEQERQAAEREQKTKENSKRPGGPIEIKPSIPTLQGAQSRRIYKVKVTDADVILAAWAKARAGRSKKDQYRAMFLRSYIRVDEAAMQAAARSKEGWEALKAEKIPGVEFWTE